MATREQNRDTIEDCNLMFLTYRQYLDGKKYGINIRMA